MSFHDLPKGLRPIAAPAAEPVSVAEAKAHMYVTITADDVLIGSLISAAREHIENLMNRAFIEQTWELTMENFPGGNAVVDLPRSPLISIESVKYFDAGGNDVTMPPADYQVDAASEPARIAPAVGSSWPSVETEKLGGVRIRFKAGHGALADDVPQRIKQAINLLVAHWYENREASVTGTIQAQVEMALKSIVSAERVYEVF